MAFPKLKTILLLGAGASQPAGIPTIDVMTKEFLKDPFAGKHGGNLSKEWFRDQLEKSEKDKLPLLSSVAKEHYGKDDLEFMMTLLNQLEDQNYGAYLETKYPKLKEILNSEIKRDDTIRLYQILIQDYIRNTCEKATKVDYLWTIDELMESKPINIFTLNYDGLIEIHCEKNHIPYTDGFDPNWNPKRFENNTGINLFKLHGSLYWLRSRNGQIVKAPIQGLDLYSMKYIDGDDLSEMMLYPQLAKDKQLDVFSWLDRKFKDELSNSDVCITIGYSFRDNEIRNSIIESLSMNPRLWLIIVNPHASKLKEEYFTNVPDHSIKVIAMDMGIEEAITERKLHSYLRTLLNARNSEEGAWSAQKTLERRLDRNWRHVFVNYLQIGHHDRIKWMMEKLLEQRFTGTDGNFPEIIEADIYPQSLQYVIEYYQNGDKEKVKFWKDIFVRASSYFEYVYFQHNLELRDHNPINRTKLPVYVQSFQSFPENTLNELKEIAIKAQQKITDESLKSKIDKLIQTIDLITYKVYTNPEKTSYRPMRPQEFLDRYSKNDLGLEKWATEIGNGLTF